MSLQVVPAPAGRRPARRVRGALSSRPSRLAAVMALVAAALLGARGPAAHAVGQADARRPLFPVHTVYWFNGYDPGRTVWNEAKVYHAPGTIVRTVTAASQDFQVWTDRQVTGLPVRAVGGVRALVLDTVNPGDWNVYFVVGSGNPVNLERVGPSPVLRLRLRWGTVLPADRGSLLIGLDRATLPLARYVTPSTARWQDVDVPLSDFRRADPRLDLTRVGSIHLTAAHRYSAESVIYVAHLCVVPAPGPAALREDLVKVDLSGWRPHDPKLALFTYPYPASAGGPPPHARFDVRDVVTNRVVYRGRLAPRSGPPRWNQTGDAVYAAAFDRLVKPGRYRVEVPGVRIGADRFTARSVAFPIREDVYTREFRDALRFFYYERSGRPIVAPYGEGYTRPAAYPTTAACRYHYAASAGHYHYTAPTRDVLGGWCDAGDPSLQVPDHAVAVWWLSNALRDFGPRVPAHSLDLPEATPGVSDLAPLMDDGLRWMAKMCNPDGSVLNTAAWGNGRTEELTDADSVAAAWAAAGFARAASVLRDVPGYHGAAARYLRLAERAWGWLRAHPGPVTQVTATRPVDPTYDAQCRVLAAVELYCATGDEQCHRYFLGPFRAAGEDVLRAWGGAGQGDAQDRVMGYLNSPLQFAYLDYAETRRPGADRHVQHVLRAAFLRQARVTAYDPTCAHTPYLRQTPYQFAMLYPGHLYWGSNANVLSVLGVVLLRAYRWTGDAHYRNAALDELHFINGRNPVGRHFVSGEAPDYAHGADFYSQLWRDLRRQPPGVLGAFINVACQLDAYVPQPWKRFVNFQEASTEEPDIAWNCEFAYFTAAFARPLAPRTHRAARP